MSITKEEMRKLQVLQNKSLRLISGLGYEASTKLLLTSCNALSVHQLVVYHTACQTYKIKQSKYPTYHYERLFRNPSFKDSLNTRYTKNEIKRIDFKLSVARSSYFYQAPQVWSSLPKYVKSAKTIDAFKKKCKKWVIKNVSIKV